jgi:membrane-bound lytic murein transglycosylase B
MPILRLTILLPALLLATPALAARCGGDFNAFVASMSAEAAAAGISQGVISQALGGVTEDAAVLNFDRQYVSIRVGPNKPA